ncbi:triose-phosphate isomerase [Bythopirellula polymerisocia]|uniref:Triosephosphate isomerase n=1 Tax=Bythopirellula polymerisocia TaxID=2528003 RepID=A0A5C6CLC7_9BACT|nr:triose-phosphate isomerase [Bythopirellula polymerisocia]TWU25693.1 Triosephosphate isomerase [Bythopirellula polymerisocia]
MRTPLIAGNWKMNTDTSGARQLASAIASRAGEAEGTELLVCPPTVYLSLVRDAIGDAAVGLGAQNVYPEANGAFTGETSTSMLCDLGVQYVILGHSERRHILGETDQDVNKKTLAALKAELRPIVCVGELLEEREAGKTSEVIRRQFEGSLANVSAEQIISTVIAYEPVWAIGTGKVATTEQAEEVHADLRNQLTSRYNAEIASKIRILYGGSVKPDNAEQLLSQPNVDGALIGGASLKADDFLAIAAAGATVAKS